MTLLAFLFLAALMAVPVAAALDCNDRTEDVDLDSGQGSEPRTDTRPPGGAHLPRVTPGSASTRLGPVTTPAATSPADTWSPTRLHRTTPNNRKAHQR